MLLIEQQGKVSTRPEAKPGVGGPLMEFASRQRLRTYRPRQVILHQSDCTDYVLIVVSGWAELILQFPGGKRQILSLALPGDLCASGLNSRAPMDHSIIAITPLTISIIGKFEFRKILSAHPRLAQSFWRNQLLLLSIQRRWTANLGQMGAIERIAHLMCELGVRQEQIGLAEGDTFSFPLTQTQIAEACGLTQVHTNRVIQDLRRRQIIDLRGKRLTVKARAELKAIARFDPAYLELAAPETPFLETRLPS